MRILRRARGWREGGFARPELLPVTIAAALLLAVAVPTLSGAGVRESRASAEAAVGKAVPAIEAYFADAGTYATMDLTVLRERYSRGLPDVTLGSLTASSYCVSATVRGQTFQKNGPRGNIVPGAPCT